MHSIAVSNINCFITLSLLWDKWIAFITMNAAFNSTVRGKKATRKVRRADRKGKKEETEEKRGRNKKSEEERRKQ